MLKGVWFVASVIAALAALGAGALGMSGPVTRPMGALVVVIGLMPVAMLLASRPGRRRTVGVLHIVAGALLGITGFVLASQDNFLRLKMATVDWRFLATSGHALAPVGWVAVGVALVLTGIALLRYRRGPVVLSALLVVLTSGYFAVSLAVVPYLYLRRRGVSALDLPVVAAAVVLLLVALLQLIAALSRVPVMWTPIVLGRSASPHTSYDDAPHPHEIVENQAMRRWVKPVVWSAVGVVAVAGISVWVWLIFGPRIVLAEAFPDPNLANCVAHELGSPGASTKVSQHALSGARSLSCNGDHVETLATHSATPTHSFEDPEKTRIRSIRGLDRLPNLVSLGLTNNGITDLTPLADLKNLTSIKLTNNKVTDLTPLAGLPALNNLGLSYNTVADLTPLTHIATLRSLGLAKNQISDLTPLAGLSALSTFDVSKNRVSDLTPLAGLTFLSTVDVSENLVSDLTPLAHLTQLSRLTLAGNGIITPAPLSDLPALSMLNIARNRISDAATFAGFPALEELWVGGNLLTDITPLADLPSLTGVDLEGAELGKTVGLDDLRARNIYVGGLA